MPDIDLNLKNPMNLKGTSLKMQIHFGCNIKIELGVTRMQLHKAIYTSQQYRVSK